jgi:hypothetical protein
MQQTPVYSHTPVLKLERHVCDWQIHADAHKVLLLLIPGICCCGYVWPAHTTVLHVHLLLQMMPK